MSPTEVLESYREPTHPAVIPRHWGEGQRLPHLALVAQATGPLMPFDDTGLDLLRAQPGQPVFHPGFARADADFDARAPTPFLGFFPLPIGQSVGPAQERTPGAAWRAVGSRIPTAKGCEEGRLLAVTACKQYDAGLQTSASLG
jgi:hypothetical protein